MNFDQLEKLLEKLNLVVPEYIYYFIPQFDFDRNDYRCYPQIFDFIESVSFDKRGLIVLYSGINCSYHLFSAKGIEIIRSKTLIKIGVDANIQFDDFSDDVEKTELEIGINSKYTDSSYHFDFFENVEKNFPDIKGRDLLPIMDNWVKQTYSKADLELLIDESMAEKIFQLKVYFQS